MLPADIPNARIISWGYDADMVHFLSETSKNSVDDHAKSLSADLGGERERTDTLERPIIFVAHSLGGLVCARVSHRNQIIPDTHDHAYDE